jgi:prepilin-type N-terminal cleavage/methylation domain-containing protein
MSMRNPWRVPASRRGMTLLETMIVVVLAAIVIAAATALLLAGGRMVHNTEHAADSHDNARIAAESIMNLVRQAGAGAPGGLWLKTGGVPLRTNALFGRDGTTGAGTTGNVATADGSDDLWLVLPDANYLGEACSLDNGQPSGAAVPVLKAGTGALSVKCTASLRPGALHVASNLTTAALLSNVQLTPDTPGTPGQVSYDEAGTDYSNAPEKGGFQAGDMVYPVRLVHFYLAINPVTGRSALYRAEGRLAPDGLGRPYSDSANPPQLVQDFVEDFQVVYGIDADNSGNPDTYTWRHGLSPQFDPNLRLRTVRVSVVATGRSPRKDNRSVAVLSDDKPLSVENHAQPPTVAADGFFRSLYSRRLELPNLAAASL